LLSIFFCRGVREISFIKI